MAEGKFAAVINCMDGRTQIPAIEIMKKQFNVDYVDTITEPGPIKILSSNDNQSQIDSIKNRLDISITKHGSNAVGVVAHFDCAGNPVEKKKQLLQLDRSVELIKSWGYDIKVVKLWIDENWSAYVIS